MAIENNHTTSPCPTTFADILEAVSGTLAEEAQRTGDPALRTVANYLATNPTPVEFRKLVPLRELPVHEAFLYLVSKCVSGEYQHTFQLTAADLRREARGRLDQGVSRFHVGAWLARQIVAVFGAVCWDLVTAALRRLSEQRRE